MAGNRNHCQNRACELIENLDVILSEGETYTVQFKKNPDKTLVTEAAAFANSSGGRIFIGITDDNKVLGTDTSNRTRSEIRSSLGVIEPPIDYTMEIDADTRVIIINVPEGKEKPYSCPAGFFMRMGDGKQKLNRDQILGFLQREGKVRYDEIVRESLYVEGHFDQKAYNRFLKLSGISEVLDRNVLLKNLGCAADTENGLVFTNVGALFFRNNDEDIEFHHAGVVCALYKGLIKVDILDAQTYESNIVDSIDSALAFLKRNLRTRYKIEGFGPRKNILELPEACLKEAITNACVHRQYFEKGASVMVEIFDDRVDVTSPGGVPSGITAKNFGTMSIARNPVIANLLHRIDYIEKMGTGINRMRLAAEEAGVAEPEFTFDTFFRVTFKRMPLPVAADVVNVGNNVVNVGSGSDRGEADSIILSFITANPAMTLKELAEKLNLSERQVQRIMKRMRENGIVVREGGTRGRWVVP
jgi:ATP-dependent DNA helicase RecG